MTQDNAAPQSELAEFLTSSQAAKRLGLSMATIQKLVDNQVLQAWKTFGGHRRISLASVLSYQNNNHVLEAPRLPPDRNAKVMLVIESSDMAARLKQDAAQWHLPVITSFQESLTEALLELLNDKHDLLVLQLSGTKKQQEKALEILHKFMGSRHTVSHALVMTLEPELALPASIGNAPVSVQVIHQELTSVWLSAYLSGFVALRRG